MLSIIPLSPFFAGVTLVTSRLARGKENVDVFKTFIEGIKNNWKRFLIHGVITYFAVIFSYFSIRLYSALISQPNADSFFLVMLYVCLIISIIIAVAFLFIFFYFSHLLLFISYRILLTERQVFYFTGKII